jgi:hypothetical protein
MYATETNHERPKLFGNYFFCEDLHHDHQLKLSRNGCGLVGNNEVGT